MLSDLSDRVLTALPLQMSALKPRGLYCKMLRANEAFDEGVIPDVVSYPIKHTCRKKYQYMKTLFSVYTPLSLGFIIVSVVHS